MAPERDPVQSSSRDGVDLYEVATWEERTTLDGLSVALYSLAVGTARYGTILVAALLLLVVGGFSALTTPEIGLLTLFSAIPALGLAAYVWYSDATTNEPIGTLVATFLLGVLTANFAAILNSVLQTQLRPVMQAGLVGSVVGSLAFFYLVVGPVEETVKLLAVRLHAFRTDGFDTVVDGAVYGAMAGLGFAFIENSLYIAQNLDAGANLDLGLRLITEGGNITAVRALAGPGHVIYSAFAGYYLGLAKFNQENAGPIIIKGLIIASVIHATYNSTVSVGAGLIAAFTPLGGIAAFLAYVLLFDGIFGGLLLRKIRRYSHAYESTRGDGETLSADQTEFE
jgi:RsiW-degrading membrane proteinase PrsW (M82 family)